MRLACLVVLAGCGRIGFERDANDGPAPIALYAFESDPADGIEDSSGNGHDGICEAACPTLIGGRVGTAYRFDDVSIRVPFTPELAPAALTATAWVYLDNHPASRYCVISKLLGTGTLNSWQLCVDPDLSVFFFSAGASSDAMSSAPAVVELGTWQRLTITWDGTFKQSWGGATVVAAHDAAIVDDSSDLILGADIDDGSVVNSLHGRLDDLRIYGYALLPDEIAALAR